MIQEMKLIPVTEKSHPLMTTQSQTDSFWKAIVSTCLKRSLKLPQDAVLNNLKGAVKKSF